MKQVSNITNQHIYFYQKTVKMVSSALIKKCNLNIKISNNGCIFL